ncbi:MAG TPA: hypothetical protein VLW50_01405 [Streptosporangiaceae bacterium]|nr:hypothetical protein [Streptosporangiaceae bacterium]
MDANQVAALRELLGPTGWLERTQRLGRALRGFTRSPGGLLVVGTPGDDPWHVTAHLEDEARLGGMPALMPTLIRWSPPPGAPAHLGIGLERLEAAQRGETLFVVAVEAAPAPLLERVSDAKRIGATVVALDQGDGELEQLAHEALAVPPATSPVSFDGAQHLVSAAAGEIEGERRSGLRERLARLLDAVSGSTED